MSTTLTLVIQILPKKMHMTLMRPLTITPDVEDGLSYSVYMTTVQSNQVTTKIFLPKSLWDQFSLGDKKLIIEYNKKIPSATKPPSTKPMPHKPKEVSIYLQEEPSQTPSKDPSGDTEETTNPDDPSFIPWFTNPSP